MNNTKKIKSIELGLVNTWIMTTNRRRHKSQDYVHLDQYLHGMTIKEKDVVNY